ncbi:hypothetical protein Tco_0844091 [Tanacetum coccineum]
METIATIQKVGTEGVVGLTQWFKKMESVFHISNYTVACQIKFATCTLLGSALSWWNSHVKTVGHDAAYGMPWKTLRKMLTDKYCPRKESDQVKKYVGGLPDMIQGSAMASKPKTIQEAIEIANDLMDQKVHTFAERQVENKRKLDNNSSNNNVQQPPFKIQNMARAYSVRPSKKKEYAGILPLRRRYYRSDCSKIKNQNHGNQTGGTEARGMYASKGDDWFELSTDDVGKVKVLRGFRMIEHDGRACIYEAFVSVDTNDILMNDEFRILDFGRKIISEDNGRI